MTSQFESKEDLMVYACSAGSFEAVLKLLQSGISPNYNNTFNITPLTAAINSRHFDIIELLLSYEADINLGSDEVQSFSTTPLTVACKNRDKPMVEFLLKQGAKINNRSGLHGTPVHASIKARDTEILLFLIENGADIEIKHGPYLDTPICLAARSNFLEGVKLLIEKEAKTKPLRKIPRKDVPQNIVKFLKSRGKI